MWYRVYIIGNYNLNKLLVEGGRELEMCFINPLLLWLQHWEGGESLYKLMWIMITVTNADALRIPGHNLYIRQYIISTI